MRDPYSVVSIGSKIGYGLFPILFTLFVAWTNFAVAATVEEQGRLLSQGAGLVTIPSRHSVAETADRFESAVKAGPLGFRVLLRIDFQEMAASQKGMVRPAQLIVFGRGGVLPALLSQAPRSAIDLPLKALAWEDPDGKTWLTYNTGEYLGQRHELKGKEGVLKRLTDITAAFAKSAAE
jgi:uncharacterized protein (DUF302 family)